LAGWIQGVLMDEERDNRTSHISDTSGDVSRFAESYASFNRIINSLQRQYIELKEEFSNQNGQLVETNLKLVEATKENLAATEFLNGILDSLSAGVIAVDQSGRITHFNPAASVLLGIPQREPFGKHYREVIPPGIPVDANCLRAAETGRSIDLVERTIDLADGTKLHISVSTAILRDNEGRPNGAVEVFHDLTKMKRMEQEFARLTTLAALGEMAATIAHEVRNPLAGIGGFAALLRRDIDDSDPRQKLVDKIIRGVENLNKTVTTLLNYTRFEEVNKEDTLYGDFLRRTIEQFRHENVERLGAIEFLIHPTEAPTSAPVIIRIDPMLFRQMVFNLCLNAIEACGRQGRIEIRCRKLPRQKAVQLYAERLLLGLDETVVETTVSDNGPGIPKESLERIFSPFFTTKPDGNGLGLAVAWKIVKAHGGEIIAENTPEGGARFLILIPAKMDHFDREIS
jgi:PAS domain S-box-containing protein